MALCAEGLGLHPGLLRLSGLYASKELGTSVFSLAPKFLGSVPYTQRRSGSLRSAFWGGKLWFFLVCHFYCYSLTWSAFVWRKALLDTRRKDIRMSRERMRQPCRRGGSRGGARGRASPPRSSASLGSPSEEINSPGARRGRGRGRGRGGTAMCSLGSHPSTRFRFPCVLDNATFFVTVRLETCEHAAIPEAPAEPRPPSPVQSSRLQPAEASGAAAGATAGTSEPTRNEPPYTDSSASDPYAYRVVEEQPSTSMDE